MTILVELHMDKIVKQIIDNHFDYPEEHFPNSIPKREDQNEKQIIRKYLKKIQDTQCQIK